jgi:hypothetical protein
MPKGDRPGNPQKQIFNAMAERGMTTQTPVTVLKPLHFKPRV